MDSDIIKLQNVPSSNERSQGKSKKNEDLESMLSSVNQLLEL